MAIIFTEDIHSVTELKRNTRAILDHIHESERPVILTVNGKADAVLMDVKTYEKHLSVNNLAKLLREGETDIAQGRTRPMRAFLKELKHAHKIPR